MHPIITIFCTFTRYWALEQWLSDLKSLKHNPALTNLAVIIDIDDPRILKELKTFAEIMGYRKFVYRMNDDWHPNEVRIAIRRMRIADVKNQSKDLIAECDGEFVISFEDDTVFTGLDIMRLIAPLHDDSRGFVEGVQCGRWGVKMIGAWRVDDPRNPKKAWTLLPDEQYQYISAGGWYGYATRKDLYLECEYYSSSAQPWGPDVNFGLWLKNQGYECMIDWESIFGHNDHNKILYPDEKLTSIIYTKDPLTGRWNRNDTDRPI